MRTALACLVGGTLVISSCGKAGRTQSKVAIQAAIERHLQQRPNVALNNLTLEVQDVKFEGARAEAEVKFRSKQSPDLAVGVHYVLRRSGESWEVESSSATGGMGGNPHGGTGGPMPAPAARTLAPQPSH